MNRKRRISLDTRARLLGALVLSLAAASAAAVEPPTVPSTSTGSYTVTYERCAGCLYDWLEERAGDSGAWTTLAGAGQTFTNRPPGRYYYRVGYAYLGSGWSYYTDYSAAASVVVASTLPTLSPLETQLEFSYEARRGDIDGDGKADLFVARTAGGAAGDGAIDAVLLRQQSPAKFVASAPSASQAKLAARWPLAAVRILLKDVNADGFADLVLDRLASAMGVAGAVNQIVYAPGEPLRSAPLGVRAIDAAFKKFAADSRNYLLEPQYFHDNARWYTYVVTYYQTICAPGSETLDQVYGYYPGCYSVPVNVVTVIPDYSVFSSGAVDMWRHESSIENGTLSRSQGVARVDGILENMAGVGVGGWTKREVVDAQHPIRSADYRRGLELFVSLLRMTEAGAAKAEESGTAARSGDAVHITGRRIVGVRAIHTALEYRGSTISAYDSIDGLFDDGTLVSQVDWQRDRPLLMMTLGTVGSSVPAGLYWVRLLSSDRRYPDNLPYDAVPSIGRAGYNSNGYASGIVQATAGRPSIPMSQFVGGERPVPSSSFN